MAVVYEGDRLTLRDPISPNKLLGNYGSTLCWFRDKAYGHFFRIFSEGFKIVDMIMMELGPVAI